ncbi:MAG: hypothetical protein RL141_325 [Candidatus Parcubacteria bacterium]
MEPRDHSRLLVMDRKNGTWEHKHFFEIGQYLQPGDLLVVNETKVFKARLRGMFDGKAVEIFLLRPEGDQWIALVKPGRRILVGGSVIFEDGRTCIVEAKQGDGTVMLRFNADANEILSWADRVGEIPIPPYVDQVPTDVEQYQTVYAKTVGSVAAPTAGFHFTPALITALKAQGVAFATVTLHVGLGTFRPIKSETIEEHPMHAEWIDVPKETQRMIAETKAAGNRVIAVGTTTVRALESDVATGFTNIFITPGYRFKVIDGLITNFHLPQSSLLVLVSAFIGEHQVDSDAGRKTLLAAYQQAIEKEYRFYSFGDAMFIR